MKKFLTLMWMLTAFCGVSLAGESDYYVIGTLNGIDGSTDWTWADSHIMTKDGDVYKLTIANVTFSDAAYFAYKVTLGNSWGTNWGKTKGGDNQDYTVNNTGSGVYTVTFTFDPSKDDSDNTKVSCEVVRTDDIYLTWGNSTDPSEGKKMTNVNGVYTASQSLTAGQYVLIVPSSSWSGSGISNWSNVAYAVGSNHYGVYIEHMTGTTEATGGYKRWQINETATYTFTYNSNTEAFTIDAQTTLNVNASAGWATFSLGSDGNSCGYTVSGADAFYVASASDKAILTSIVAGAKIPTYPHGIMLKKIGGGEVTITTQSESDVTLTNNMLQGSGRYTTWNIDNSGYTGYYLYNGASGLGFYPANTGAMSAYKAFLKVPNGGARDFFSFEEENATAINAVKQDVNANGNFFNLAGQRVAQPAKGLYIVNGKKVIVK